MAPKVEKRIPYRPGYSGEGALPRDWKPPKAKKPAKKGSKKD